MIIRRLGYVEVIDLIVRRRGHNLEGARLFIEL